MTYDTFTIAELYKNWDSSNSSYYISEDDLIKVQSLDTLKALYANLEKLQNISGHIYPVKRIEKIDDDLYHTIIENEEGEEISLIDADIKCVFKLRKETDKLWQ